MRVRFCTLFDSRYATRGLVMLQSLDAYRRSHDEIFILAIDEQAQRMVSRINPGHWQIVKVAELHDSELRAAEQQRPRREFCWTCTPAMAAWLVHDSDENDIVVYLDADLLFFNDPRILLVELDEGASVLIHEHRFSPDRIAWEPTSGRFNVGFVAFKVGDEARECADRWRAQTMERCVLDPENGYCGDQSYLNEWPGRYPNLRIMRNVGGGVAPWNVNQYRLGRKEHRPTVDDREIVFFHYHALKTLAHRTLGMVAVQPAYGYDLPAATQRIIFRPYSRRLGFMTLRMRLAGFPIEHDRVLGVRELVAGIVARQFVPAI